ncbi:hypothetical protein C5S35_01295 [Candidatus Methanophagaceae archaeon]|nr:hypothetical protein C5S35_01295 [Methanophagales archaeon]
MFIPVAEASEIAANNNIAVARNKAKGIIKRMAAQYFNFISFRLKSLFLKSFLNSLFF